MHVFDSGILLELIFMKALALSGSKDQNECGGFCVIVGYCRSLLLTAFKS